MARQSKLTHEQWAIAKARWEGSDKPGFKWLAYEIEDAWGHKVSRQVLEQAARLKAWEKGGPQSQPIPKAILPDSPSNIAGGGKTAAKPSTKPKKAPQPRAVAVRNVAKEAQQEAQEPPPEVADEVVPPAGEEPPKTTRKRNTVGRPTKYEERFCELILDFFDKEPYTEFEVTQPSGRVMRQHLPTSAPMLADFAKTIGVSVDTLGRWANEVNDDGGVKRPEFAEAYARAREMHESLLVRGGLMGMYAPQVVQSALKNLHGWQDQPARKVAVAAVSKEELDRRFGDRMLASRQRMQAMLEERANLFDDEAGAS